MKKEHIGIEILPLVQEIMKMKKPKQKSLKQYKTVLELKDMKNRRFR